MKRIKWSLLAKIVLAFVFVLFPFFFLIEYVASSLLEEQVIDNVNATLKVYTINEGKDLDKLFAGYAKLGETTAEFIRKALTKPLPESALSEFDKKYKQIKGAVRTDLAASLDKDIPGVFISNLTKLDDNVKKEVMASGKEFFPYARAARNQVYNAYYISKNRFLRIYEKDWALEIEPDHDFHKDSFFYVADPAHDPERKPAWTHPYYDSIIKHWMISVITPVYVNDKFMGIAGHDVILDKIYADVLDKKIFKSGYSFIFDSEKHIVVHPHYLDRLAKTAAMGTELSFSDLKERGLVKAMSDAVGSGKSYSQYSFYEGNKKYNCYIYRLGFMDWYFASVVPEDELLAMLPEFMGKFIAGAVVCGVLIFVLVVLIVWFYILFPLKKITKATEIIGEGNLNHKIELASNDELGFLASSFNSMVLRLRDREEQINAQSEELKKANAELTGHREHLEELVAAQTKELKEQNRLLEDRMNAYSHLVKDMKIKLDSVGDPIRIINKDYCISYANKSFLEMCGVEKEEDIIGEKCHDIFPGETCHTERCPLKLVMNGEEKVDEDVRKELPDGEKRFYILDARPYYSEDRKVIGVMEIFKDVTVRREMQDMAECNAQQQGRMEMANNVLHDIGNALTGISVHALKPQNQTEWEEIKSIRQLRDLFARKSPELISAFGREKSEELIKFMDALLVTLEKRCDSSIEFTKNIARAVGHMTSVLDLQRLYMKENGAPLATDIALGNMIEDALLMLAAGAEKREIEVKTSFDGQNPRVAGDQTRLIRVFLNIIKNAYEAFDADNSDDPKILTANVYVDNENDQAVIVFADNASGFHSDSAESFFERGFSTKERGLGIGLQECRSIIESHSGTVAIESEGEGKGAKVIIKLPLLKAKG